MNKHDVKRKEQLIKTLEKAREQAENAFIYLVAGGINTIEEVEAAGDMKLTLEHIEIALERLTADRPSEVRATEHDENKSEGDQPMTCPCGCGMDPCLES